MFSFILKKRSSLFVVRWSHVLYLLILLYFLTLHADQLHLKIGAATVRFNNLVALMLSIVFLFRQGKNMISIPKSLLLSISCLTCSIVLSLLFSPFKERCLLFLGWYGLTLLGYFILPFLFMLQLDVFKVVRLYFYSFVIVGLYAFMQLLLSMIGICDPFAEQMIGSFCVRPNAFAYEPSYYALYMTPFVIMANLHFLMDKRRDFIIFKELNLKKLMFINALYLISTTTSALFGFFVFLSITFFYEKLKYMRPSLLKFAGCIVFGSLCFCFIFPDMTKKYFLKFFFEGVMHNSFLERWVGICNAWQVFLDYPFWGVGLGGVPEFLKEACFNGETHFVWLYPADLILDAPSPLKFFEPSNVFTEVLASLGVLGVCAFGFLIFNFYRSHKGALRMQEKDREAQHWITLFFISFLVTLVVLQFNQGLFRTYIWTHFALCYGYFLRAQQNKLCSR